MEFNVDDFEQCDKLIRSIANKEFYKYQLRVSFTKLDFEDFYQNGWVALQDCKNKQITNLDYICTALRNAMYRGVTKSSIIQTSNKAELWYYISGHEDRLENQLSDDGISFEELLPSSENVEQKVINSVLVGQIFENISKDDKVEILRLMNNLPPLRRKLRENAKVRAKQILEGKHPYKLQKASKRSKIIGVTYDKSKDRWVFSKRINGKTKVFIRNKSQEVVESYAEEWYGSLQAVL